MSASYKLGGTRAVAFREYWQPDTVGLFIHRFDHQKSERAKITWEPYEPGDHAEASAFIDATEAQRLMDSLWDCGLRPTSGAGSAGAMAAAQAHLQDMRALVFKLKPEAKL